MKMYRKFATAMALAVSAIIFAAGGAMAHCDTLDGPVIEAARQALDKKDVKIVLPWVAKEKEGEIAEAFVLAMAVRGKGAKEKELADRYFFETLVRVHREGEGAPFTGLKPAGMDMGPAVPAADKALETGNPGPLLDLINEAVHSGIHKRFVEARERKAHAGESVEAGRAYVAAYVPYVHFVERIYDDAARPAAHAGHAGGEAPAHAH